MTEEEELELLRLRKQKALATASRLVPQKGGASGTWELPDPGPLAALRTKFNEGLTKKASDELVGAIAENQLEPMPGRYLRLPDGRELPARTKDEARFAFREGERLNQEAAKQHWPKLSFLGDMAGEIAGDTALAGSRMVSPVYQAGAGAFRGYFGTDSDKPMDQAVNSGAGALLGYGFGKLPEAAEFVSKTPLARSIAQSSAGNKAGEVLMSTVRWPGEALRSLAAGRATKAAGLIQKDLTKLPPGTGKRIGEELLDRGIMKPFRTAEELRPGILDARREVGETIGATHAAADALSGGSGAEVRRAVAERRAADQGLMDDWASAEKMYTGAARTRAAEEIAKREALETAVKNDALFDAGAYDQQIADHLTDAQRFAAALREEADRAAASHQNDALEFVGGLNREVRRTADGMGTALEQADKHARKFYSLLDEQAGAAPDRTPGFMDLLREREALAPSRVRPAPLLADLTPNARVAAASDLAAKTGAARFGERGTEEAFKAAKTIPFDIARDAPVPADPRALTQGLGFDAHRFADSVESKLLPELDDPVLKPLKTQIQTLLAGYRAKAARGMSHAEANAWKTNIQKTISKFMDAPISQDAKIRLQSILDDEIESGIASKLGADALPEYRAAKSSYGLLKEAAKGNRSAIARGEGNNSWGMTELMAMGAGGTAGLAHGSLTSALGGFTAAAGAHLLKHRGASAAAVAANGLSKLALGAVENAPHLFGEFGAVIASQKTPEARAAIAEELANRFPQFAEMLGAYGDDEQARAPSPTDRLRAARSSR